MGHLLLQGYAFRVKAGATYQRAMVTLFHDMIHKEMEMYVDDMIVKTKPGEDHVKALEKLFKKASQIQAPLKPR